MTDGTTENPVSSNITEVHHAVDQRTRWLLNGHRGGVLWLTGLSGSGKSTIGVALERRLLEKGWRAYMLDGDNVRHRLNRDLGFSPEDRKENIRRIGEVAALFAESGVIVITCFISPYRDDRRMARDAAGDAFHEIHLSASLETCEERDPKGLYKKARAGMIQDFTGISAPYEVPLSAELTLDTGSLNLTKSLDTLEQYIQTHFLYLGEEASAAAS